MAKKVAVIMGSDSDLPVVKGALTELDHFGISYEVHVMSAHRTPALAAEFAGNAKKNGFGVILAAAGKAAHLGGVLAAHTTLPVIGIPVSPQLWMDWMHCWQRFRCRKAFRWLLLQLMVQQMQQFWLHRCLLCRIRKLMPSWNR